MNKRLDEIIERLERVENLLNQLVSPSYTVETDIDGEVHWQCTCGSGARCYLHHPFGTYPGEYLEPTEFSS